MHDHMPSVPVPSESGKGQCRGVVYEHIRVNKDTLEFCGEHIMSHAGPLRRVPGFYGADEAITNFREGRAPWVATLITTGKDRQAALHKRSRVLEGIKRDFGLKEQNNGLRMLK